MKNWILAIIALAAIFTLTACDSGSSEPAASKKITNTPASGQAGTAVERNESGDK